VSFVPKMIFIMFSHKFISQCITSKVLQIISQKNGWDYKQTWDFHVHDALCQNNYSKNGLQDRLNQNI
jgi:hypothetical protein